MSYYPILSSLPDQIVYISSLLFTTYISFHFGATVPNVVCTAGHNEVGQARSALWTISDWGGSVSRKPPHYCRTADRSVPARFTQSCLSERVVYHSSHSQPGKDFQTSQSTNVINLNCDCSCQVCQCEQSVKK